MERLLCDWWSGGLDRAFQQDCQIVLLSLLHGNLEAIKSLWRLRAIWSVETNRLQNILTAR